MIKDILRPRKETQPDGKLVSANYIRENLGDLLLDAGNIELVLDTIDETDSLTEQLRADACHRATARGRRRRTPLILIGAASIAAAGLVASQSGVETPDVAQSYAGSEQPQVAVTPLHPQGVQLPAQLPCTSTPLHPCEVPN